VAVAAAAAFVAPLCAAATAGLEHAALMRSTATVEATGEVAAEEGEASVNDQEEGKDGEAANKLPSSLAALDPEAMTAFESSGAELPLHLHTALLKQAFNYEAWDMFAALHTLATLRLREMAAAHWPEATDAIPHWSADEGGPRRGVVMFSPQAVALGVTSDVLAAVRAVQIDGDPATPSGTGAPGAGTAGLGGDAGAAEDEDEESDALHALGETLRTLSPEAAHACADIVTDAALLLWSLVKVRDPLDIESYNPKP
jgi:hypothetical protein